MSSWVRLILQGVQFIEELVTVLETDKEMLPAFTDVPKKQFLEEAFPEFNETLRLIALQRLMSFFKQAQLMLPIAQKEKQLAVNMTGPM